jgi:anti-sigma regulatory factor (Ser/Thr protein kinase)
LLSCDHVLHDKSLVPGESVVNVHADLAASPQAAGRARALVASVLRGGAGVVVDEDVVYTALLVTSSLVTNAVLHARTDLHLGVCRDDHSLLVAVVDGVPASGGPIDGDLAHLSESGRGMTIVATVAADFGWRQRADLPGKIMWARIDLDGATGPTF